MATGPAIPRSKPGRAARTTAATGELADYQTAVANYTAAGADETVQRIVTALSRVTKRLDGFYRDQLADLELHRGDWAVLSELATQDRDARNLGGGAATPSHLADIVGVSPSTMTHRLDLLAERGLVKRTPDPVNRTRSRVSLTRAGRDLFRRAILDANMVESDVLAGLTSRERRQLADLLEKLVARNRSS